MRLLALSAVFLAAVACTPSASAAPPPSCAPAAADAATTRSSDGKIVVYVETDASKNDATATGDVAHQRICVARDGGTARVVLEGKSAPVDAGVEKTLADLGNLVLSPDGATLYFTSAAWVTSGAAHAVDLATGKERFLVDGAILEILVDGPYKGNLLASHYRLDTAHSVESPEYRGRMETYSVLTTLGKTVAKLPEDERARTKALTSR